MYANSLEYKSLRRPEATPRWYVGSSNSLLRNILPVTHSFSIFCRQTRVSNPSNPKKARILREPAEKNFNQISKAIRPVVKIASL
jgi:hypothetical protein